MVTGTGGEREMRVPPLALAQTMWTPMTGPHNPNTLSFLESSLGVLFLSATILWPGFGRGDVVGGWGHIFLRCLHPPPVPPSPPSPAPTSGAGSLPPTPVRPSLPPSCFRSFIYLVRARALC